MARKSAKPTLLGQYHDTRQENAVEDLELIRNLFILWRQITVHRLHSPADEPYESFQGRNAIIQKKLVYTAYTLPGG
jgi:hypothetical protein